MLIGQLLLQCVFGSVVGHSSLIVANVKDVCHCCILANFLKVEVGTLEMGCDLDHSDRKAIIARAKPSLF